MIMVATVIRTDTRSMLVRDSQTGNEVLVNFSNASRFTPGDQVRITYNGIMTHSIPPQITANAVSRISGPGATSQTEMRATILQVRPSSLLVRDLSNNRETVVNFASASHFCVGQRIIVRYNTITLSNPPQVSATSITPVC